VPKARSGGPSSPFFGIGHLLRLRSEQLAFYRDMQARYGDAVLLRLGTYRTWLLFHPEHIEEVLASQASCFIRFERVMRVLAQWNGQSLLVSEGERWRARRREVLPAFASRRLPGYGDRIVARTLAMCDAWEAVTRANAITLDTDREMVALTLEIAADTLFGERLEDEAADIGSAVATLSEVAFRESTTPFQVPDWVPLPLKARKRRAMMTMGALVKRIVDTRMEAPKDDRGDLLSILVDGGRAEPTAVRDEVMTLLIAGHETTGATLSWASYLLGRHPHVLNQVQNEIENVVGSRPPSANDLSRLELLRRVIEETLRLYPPAYALFPRRATSDVAIGDLTIRKGDLAQIVPIVTQRDPRWFEDPSAFRPSRFSGEPRWPRYAYVPFGAGPRVCIGQAFGILETGLALATMLQRFSPMSVETSVTPDPKFSLRPMGGLRQTWSLRGRRD
jgi:cytochrome P450